MTCPQCLRADLTLRAGRPLQALVPDLQPTLGLLQAWLQAVHRSHQRTHRTGLPRICLPSRPALAQMPGGMQAAKAAHPPDYLQAHPQTDAPQGGPTSRWHTYVAGSGASERIAHPAQRVRGAAPASERIARGPPAPSQTRHRRSDQPAPQARPAYRGAGRALPSAKQTAPAALRGGRAREQRGFELKRLRKN